MLARLLSRPSHFRLLSNLSSKPLPFPLPNPLLLKPFSTDNNNNNSNNFNNSKLWNLSEEPSSNFDSLLGQDSTKSLGAAAKQEYWVDEDTSIGGKVLGGTEMGVREDQELFGEGYERWNLEEEEKKDELFDIGVKQGDHLNNTGDEGFNETEEVKTTEEDQMLLLKEKEELSAVLNGPNRAFGDLIAASGITDEMLDSLIALKDFEEVDGLPPLRDIEDMRYEKNTRKSTRAEIERQKQEEFAKARVRQVDEKGRAYGTGRRKCSIARVWIQPGDGKFLVNDKQFDVYFPMLDHRAALLQPFSETKTLGLWDINCTVKGGGVSGQVGAIQLGISRALQNWEPDMRPALRSVGLLTRDPRAVERKKPGKAKARKSFQWVKR